MQKLSTRNKKKLASLVASLILIALGYTVVSPGKTPKVPYLTTPGLYHVIRDIDGDTIVVGINGKQETIRLLGVDTPETHDPRKPVQCFGETAAAFTKNLVEDKDVRLEADPSDSDRDKYGRLLRYVYLPNGTFVNAELVKQGYAFAYTVFPLTKLDQFRALEKEARENNRGLWAGCGIDSSTDIKQTTGNK